MSHVFCVFLSFDSILNINWGGGAAALRSIPVSGIKSVPPAVEAWSLNNLLTAREEVP